MEFTISQLNSAFSSWSAKTRPATMDGARSEAEAASAGAAGPTRAAVHAASGIETEYDQFGRFGATRPERSHHTGNGSPKAPTAINCNKNFRAGNATVSELEQEYARTLAGKGDTERRFIPAGMTEYSVSVLTDYQYRWAIDVERRAVADTPVASEAPTAGAQAPHES